MSDIVLPRRSDAWRRALAPALCAGLAVAVGTDDLARLPRIAAPAPPPAAPAAPSPRWLDIPRPVQIYSLETPELRRAPLVYSARRLASGALREDRLAFGAMAGGKPMLRLSILRGAATPTLAEAMAALVAADGVEGLHTGAPAPLATRFGAFEVTAATLGAAAGSACDAFRLTIRDPGLAITGLSCSDVSRPLPRAALACLIDRLDVASAGEDRALARLFAAAELRRDPTCGGMRLAPDGLHAPWLDDKPATPPVKTRRHARLIRPAQAT